ncbi:hypothetical protein GLOTRDRAFT_91673 [Gloeophyllum trabeum ATCC 11539]|uniref:rRNA-processing protein FYV7 n=1 Tax=Gloeophyllum trabeum (strain ATCC 11539 / FP-39264 / Madison 617) TaxID=670483 RepID=S7RXS9_GLOTA|nr:uncharacterized protein GLOTRDRAFT_91673 [Gloeophyllum trabeum ATCC 11539]EPQ58179.1 hypothetical protein GLOTRDRAFT_91673 [Gloeophyllum trabeum ATCC 11539]
MATITTDSVKKRKRPPTFQHLPENRAKKLKKAWVETQKIKSKWKAEKRKTLQSSVAQRADTQDLEQLAHGRAGKGQEPQDITPDAAGDSEEESEQSPDELVAEPQYPLSESVHRSKAHQASKHPHPSGPSAAAARRLPESSRSRGRGARAVRGNSTACRGRKRQPDMRQRMNNLLDKIKRDYA